MNDVTAAHRKLDAFALLACQDYNLGNSGNWFFNFRSAMSGVQSRMLSVEEQRALLYEWHAGATLDGHERRYSLILFAMDSAVECLVFALNSLGQAWISGKFRSVSDQKTLRKISPNDVVNLQEWSGVFPSFTSHFKAHADLLELITSNHDVTKHRRADLAGGTVRSDPPPGFFDDMGIPDGHPARHMIAPMKEVLISKHAKLPVDQRPPDLGSWTKLEDVITEFRSFMHQCMCLATEDALSTIRLKVSTLRR